MEAAATIEVGVNIAASADVVPGGVDAAIAEQVRRYLGERLDAQEGALGEVVDDVDNAARWIMRGLVTGGIGVLLAGIGQVIR